MSWTIHLSVERSDELMRNLAIGLPVTACILLDRHILAIIKNTTGPEFSRILGWAYKGFLDSKDIN